MTLAFQAVQIGGALLVLVAFAAAQWGVLSQKSRAYLALNFVGSLILALQAGAQRQWGFILLEGVWALLSGAGLLRRS